MAGDPDQVDWAWICALHVLDGLGNKQQLLKLLRSETPLSPLVRSYLADLIERGVAKSPGRPRTPAYTLSDKEAALVWASEEVRYQVRERGLLVKEAVSLVAPRFRVDPDHLADHYAGRHHFRRAKAGIPPYFPSLRGPGKVRGV